MTGNDDGEREDIRTGGGDEVEKTEMEGLGTTWGSASESCSARVSSLTLVRVKEIGGGSSMEGGSSEGILPADEGNML